MEFKKLFLIILLLSLFAPLYGQMQMGIAHDNVNVTEKIRINPALSVDPIQWIDIKVAGIYAIAANNAAYMAKDSFNLWKLEFPNSLSQNFNKENVNGQIEATVYGPAINISFGKLSVGASTAVRSFAYGRKLTQEIARAMIDGPQIPSYYGERFDGNDYRVKGLGFGEVGINAGYMVYQMGGKIINIGANVKYIFGIGGINMLVDNFNYEMHDTNTATIYNYSGQYGGTDLKFNSGKGVGIDIGFTFEQKVNKSDYTPHSPGSKCKYTEYLYRFGFSVLDIGSIKFKNSPYRKVENGNGPWDDYNTNDAGNVTEVISGVDNLVGNGITETSTEYKAKLPLSFSLQFDYNIGRGMYVNAFLLYGVGLKNSFGAERLSMFSVTPRYESKRIGIGVPLSINQLGKGGVGLSFRFWYLSFGTDNLIPIFFNTDVYRLDAYAQVKIPLFRSPQCKRKGLGETDWRFKDCSAPGAVKRRGKTKRSYLYH